MQLDGINTPDRSLVRLSPVTSQGALAVQFGLSYLAIGGVALTLYIWMISLHLPQPYPVALALGAGCLTGLLCTLNVQYALYLLELSLARLARFTNPPSVPLTPSSQSTPSILTPHPNDKDYTKYLIWPLGTLFTRLQEAEQRLSKALASEQIASELREKALQQASEAAAQAERNRIARELHDSIKQQIFGISISAAAARALWQENASEDARAAVEDIQRSAKEAQIEMQALLQQLRPAPLENISLLEALRIQAQALSFRTGAQIHIDLAEMPGNDRLLPGTQDTIFRLVQEAFANIAKHARAQTIWLTLRVNEQTLEITIRDDGQGFTMATAQKGMGLRNLHERTQELHGRIDIQSQPGKGTTVVIHIPLLERLSSPEALAARAYALARTEELARRGYQLCENTAVLGLALILLTFVLNIPWIIIAADTLLALYGYLSGIYYRTQVALHTDPQSRNALELKYREGFTRQHLTRLLGLSLWCSFAVAGLLDNTLSLWILLALLGAIILTTQFLRHQHYKTTEAYYKLFSRQELHWELERRYQNRVRSMTYWLVASLLALLINWKIFLFSSLHPNHWIVYGLAALILLVDINIISDYRQIQRWRQTLNQREPTASSQEVSHG